jgi:hypothetical protein
LHTGIFYFYAVVDFLVSFDDFANSLHYQVDEMMKKRSSKQGFLAAAAQGAADRVLAERMQIYDRLAMGTEVSPERLSQVLALFSIAAHEKKKKVALSECICTCESKAIVLQLSINIVLSYSLLYSSFYRVQH